MALHEKPIAAVKKAAAAAPKKAKNGLHFAEHACAFGYALHEFHFLAAKPVLLAGSAVLLAVVGVLMVYRAVLYLVALMGGAAAVAAA